MTPARLQPQEEGHEVDLHPIQGHRARKTEIPVTQGGAEGTYQKCRRAFLAGVARGVQGDYLGRATWLGLMPIEIIQHGEGTV